VAEILWLEPTRKTSLPPSSIFFASGRFVLSTFVLGDFDVDRRSKAYRRVVEVILKRSRELSLGDIRVKHSLRSSEIVGSVFPPYPFPKPPRDLSSSTSFPDIIAEQELLHGQLEEQDKLKLVFQAVYGGQHLFSDPQTAWDNFHNEWNSLESINDEPLAERISPEGDLYRINLRAAKELGISLGKLFEAAKRSAERISENLERRKARLLPQSRSLGIKPDAVPVKPIRHSDSYRLRVRPSYRLIHACDIADLLE
jgi:hypothetical protein